MKAQQQQRLTFLCAGLVLASLSGCGGGGSSAASSPPPSSGNEARIAAATTTAQTNPECVAVQPFYWEIGDQSGALASGAVGGSTFQADTVVNIASASKWLYGMYVVQKRAGALTADDVKYLRFYSGYTNFETCQPGDTVGSCLDQPSGTGTNGSFVPSTENQFFYGGGHMQKHATAIQGLGALDNRGLAAEITAGLGGGFTLAYSQPQLAGGARMSAAEYAKVLRRVLAGQLAMRNALGTNAVCTSMLQRNCATSIQSPSPPLEVWQYSVGHWIEDTTNASDGAFSSLGAFGFYPWIDKTKTWYGVVSRAETQGALDSMFCGRLIRKAWVTSTAQ